MMLSKKLSKEYLEKGKIGSCPITYFTSIDIYDTDFGEYVIWNWNNEEVLHKSKLKVKFNDDKELEFKFRVGNDYMNLNDFLRIPYEF